MGYGDWWRLGVAARYTGCSGSAVEEEQEGGRAFLGVSGGQFARSRIPCLLLLLIAGRTGADTGHRLLRRNARLSHPQKPQQIGPC